MRPPSSARQLLAGRTLHITVAGLLAPLGACVSEADGAGGAQQCRSTDEYAAIDAILSNGQHYDCSGAANLELTNLEGVVRKVASNAFAVDSCHPNANCAPTETFITLSGTDLFASIPDGTFVHVDLYRQPPQMGCMLHFIVRNVPVWGGTPNPTSDGTFLWLAYNYGLDGFLAGAAIYALPYDPYHTKRVLACKGDPESPAVFAWRFSFPDAPGAEVVAPQGQTVTWSVPEGEHAGQYRVRNVRAVSYTHNEYNYWIARK